MTNNVARNDRRNRAAPAAPVQRQDSGPSMILVVALAAAAGFGAFWLVGGSASLPMPELAAIPGLASRTPTSGAGTGAAGPRYVAAVAGVREITGEAMTGLSAPGRLSISYLPVGPVVFRKDAAMVEVDGPRLLPPPIGRARTERAVFDHAAILARDLASLSSAACDSHLRHLAAANVTLFIAGFFPARTPVHVAAAPDTAFWQRPETSAVRRTVAELVAIGALGPSDFGLDTSPQVKGLFQGLSLRQPSCP